MFVKHFNNHFVLENFSRGIMFTGLGTAIITPFNEDYSVDYNSLEKIVVDQLEKNVDALIVLGTTGEAPTISDQERIKITETVVSLTKNKAKVIIGTGNNDTQKVVRYNKLAEDAKADGVLIVNPYYNKGTQASLVEHYKFISERTSLPIILYNVPSRTSMNLFPETICKIYSECKNVVAVKEASGDISQISKLMTIKPEELKVYSGNDDQTLPIMALGASGVISVFSNVFPEQMSLLTKALLGGNFNKARELNNRYLKMMNLLFIETNPMPVKYAVSLRGLCKNILRLPLNCISENSEKILKEEFKKISSEKL